MNRTSWGLDAPRSDEWRDHAACSPATAEWFWIYAGKSATVRLSADNKAALELCWRCPVREQCEQYESANPERFARIAGGVVWTGREVARCG